MTESWKLCWKRWNLNELAKRFRCRSLLGPFPTLGQIAKKLKTCISPVCLDPLGLLGVFTKHCCHSFCRGCLKRWAYACQPNSHMCPKCRQELFSHSKYRPREGDVAIDYGNLLNDLAALEVPLYNLQFSSISYKRSFNCSSVVRTERQLQAQTK
jgi:hypothetical protein